MEKVLQVQHLQKNFGKFQALKDVSFDIEAGEVVGYLGPNGAGKSTTLRVLLGIIKANAGSVKIFGRDVWKEAIKIHKDIAYVPGDVYLWPNLSGGEIIDLFLKLHGKFDPQKRDELIQKFELDPKKKSRSYSKGNRQKIALIAALACQAELYIFDEPTSGLDPLMEAIFQEEVMALKAQGKAILLSSHILSEVEKLADRVVIIRQGEIVENGTLEALRHLTRSVYKVELKQAATLLTDLATVHDLKVTGSQATFSADSNQAEAVLADLLKLGIVKLEITPPTLEDLFMRHYEA